MSVALSQHVPQTRCLPERFASPALVAILALWVGGCLRSDPPSDDVGTRPQQLGSDAGDSTSLMTLQVKAWSQAEATKGLQTSAGFQVRGTPTGFLIEATSGALATATDAASRANTLLAFLREYGVLLCDPVKGAPSEAITFRQVGGKSEFRTKAGEGGYVMLLQSIDGFSVQDTLVTGRFLGNVLHKVAGQIFDPSLSPSRKPLACSDAAEARQKFIVGLSMTNVPDGFSPAPYVFYAAGSVYWRSGFKRLDAVTCNWMADVQRPIEDPAPMSAGGGQP